MKNFYAALVCFFVVQASTAQVSPAYQAMQANEILSGQKLLNEPNQSELLGLDYDVKYYRLEVRINPDSTGPSASPGKYIKGAITTYFTTRTSNFGQIKFDFANSLICDSVVYHGAKLNASNITEQTDTLKISIPLIAAAGTLDSVKVFYKGIPPVVTDFGGSTGYVKGSHSSGNYIYTLSEPYSAFTWWPCKSKVAADKADSVDIIVSTPSAFMVAANGKRISEVISGGNKVTTWKHRYPISSYQVAIGVGYYEQWPVTPTIVNIGGTNMDFYNLLWVGTNTAAAKTALGRTPEMLTIFSNKFSDYPFKKEKYGHYTFGFGGGMEHNTFSGMGPTTYDQSAADWSVIAHELGHQWFGASVTCGSWSDIWVNESFARYSEVVYLDNKTDATVTATPFSHRTGLKSSALANNAKPIYQADTSTMTTIFNPSVYIYDRGAMFISMLRKTLGDAKFFQALQNYQTDPALKNSNAFTADVKRHMEAVSGLDLTEMFNDWIYKKGHALYNGAKWNNFGNQVVLQLPQTVNSGSDNTHFDIPVVIRFTKSTAPTGDTTITLFDKGGVLYKVNNGVFSSASGGNLIQIGLPFVPTRIVFDSLAETMSAGAFVKDPTLSLLATNVVNFSAQKDNRNAKLAWSIDQSFDYNSFEIERSTNGTVFEKIGTQTSAQNNNARNFSFTDYNIPAGIIYYRVKVVERNGSSFYTKIASINTKSTESFVVTPNPATDYINISHGASASLLVNVKITDAAGRLVKSLTKQSVAAGNNLRVSLAGFAAGTYYVEIEGEEYFKVVKKIALIK